MELAPGSILYLDGVTVSFEGFKALNDLSFIVKPGEMRAIIGPNGAGKTSMLNVINGFYHPQRGRISFKGSARARMRPYDAALGGIARRVGRGGRAGVAANVHRRHHRVA